MHGDFESVDAWIKNLIQELDEAIQHEVVLCVQPLLVSDAIKCLSRTDVKVGCQDCHFEDKGAYTGFTSPKLLSHMHCDYVIVGHSERRSFEDDDLIHKKVLAAQRNHLIPVICVGESLDARNQGKQETFVLKQLEVIMRGAEPSYCIAYEPLWAIGTGVMPTLDDIAAMHTAIKGFIHSDTVRVLYGGSVRSDNAGSILSLSSVDGLLVGGASLYVVEFKKILLV